MNLGTNSEDQDVNIVVESDQIAPASGNVLNLPERIRANSYVRSGRYSRFSLILIFAALIVLFSFLAPDTFPHYSNFVDIATAAAPLLLLALAETTVLRAGHFDLSLSAIMIVSGVVAGRIVLDSHAGTAVAILAALAVGAVLGLINGFIVVTCRLDSFIATLGSMTVITGLIYALTDQNVVAGYAGALISLARSEVFGMPWAVADGWIVGLVLLVLFEWTVLGRQWLFVGGNKDAARLLGLPVQRLQIVAFVLAGLISGIAGVLLAGGLGSVDPSSSGEYLLTPFAAAFLGTIAISVGRFNVIGTVLGLYTIVVGQTGLALLGAPVWVGDVFSGGTLLVAIGFAALVQREGFSIIRARFRRSSAEERI
jgi:ribose transport system permease protein